ncbi:MAG: MMPL family transporter [Candidatus Synoicihabitans palmerolidicus]|nr:MMPL family transporter [Candidatus Synoicihabitans palmerolidicus]
MPVVALGVGIGVDYGIYIFPRFMVALRRGEPFEAAMFEAFTRTGNAWSSPASRSPSVSVLGFSPNSNSKPTWGSCSPSCSS